MVDADALMPVETDCPSKAGTPAATGISQSAGRPMDGRGMGVESHVLGVGTSELSPWPSAACLSSKAGNISFNGLRFVTIN
ncbi:MAG: hypothetical protein [Caudoviricetes sp.]|nr:MAG: hypothetical protein [Caudoviricetes sp.]